MTARPGRRRRGPSSTGGDRPREVVEIPEEVLARARREPDALAAVEVVEAFLRDRLGPMPDLHDDRDRWLRWVEEVEERALGLLESGDLREEAHA